MPESNKAEKADLFKSNWIKHRDARGRFMAATTPVEEPQKFLAGLPRLSILCPGIPDETPYNVDVASGSLQPISDIRKARGYFSQPLLGQIEIVIIFKIKYVYSRDALFKIC